MEARAASPVNMDRFFNSNRQSMTSYLDIFKACRLCGSGGGYKMPIIQKINNDDIIDVEAELKEKIKECVSIEVNKSFTSVIYLTITVQSHVGILVKSVMLANVIDNK